VLAPAFGEADLTNCDQEQIQLAGSIQPHGALLVVSEPDLMVTQASANAAAFLGLNGPVLELSLHALGGNLAERIAPHLAAPLDAMPVGVRCRIGARRGGPERGDTTTTFDVLLHRVPQSGLVVELERPGPPVDLSAHLEAALQRVLASFSLRALSEETAGIVRDLTGYDRVMVYRFDDAGHGEVFAENRAPHLPPLLGNRYPATDIPELARRLYERNRVRVLVDVDYTPSPILPPLAPAGDQRRAGEPLDMSLCVLRSVSPIHIQYLKNMGVGATLVASLMVGGRLWGLIACHHDVPLIANFQTRALCELLAEAVATRIAALESFARGHADLSVRRLEQRLVESISREGDWRGALFDGSLSLLQPLGATGAALLFEGQILTAGEVPGTQKLRQIAAWLDGQPAGGGAVPPVIHTASLGLDEPSFAGLAAVASGLIAVPVSTSPGEYLMWFRPEQVHTVTWAGDPFKAVAIGNKPADLSPRRSFAQWHQLVERTSEGWGEADISSARLIGETVTDVILQFRSVRMLIAQDQLDQIRRQLRLSEQPVVIADAAGRLLLTNEAFERLLRPDQPPPQFLDDLPPLFAEAAEVRRRLGDMLRTRAIWRGEVTVGPGVPSPLPFLVRADPVFSAPGRVLGFVLMFTDLSGQKKAEAARKRFQERLHERRGGAQGRLDAKSEALFQSLMAAMVENAQLAALEIGDGVDMARMAEMLESVRASVTRSTGMLEHLLWQVSRAAESD
jgi:light-regulated signal transduction histidine kinase (bacteriophytochrome)